MPFLPWTFVIYVSEYLLVALAIILIQDFHHFNSFARQAFASLFIIGAAFFLFPTIYPRPFYPPQENALVAFAMNLIATADAPTNCFPSMHVAITAITVYALRHQSPAVWRLFVLWGAAIILTTLTTKQHYLIDILGGLAVASAVISFDRTFVRQKATQRNFASVRRKPGQKPDFKRVPGEAQISA